MIFQNGGNIKKVNLPDKVLLQRLVPLVVLMGFLLALWTVFDQPLAETILTANQLKFSMCRMTAFAYGIYGGEDSLLNQQYMFNLAICIKG